MEKQEPRDFGESVDPNFRDVEADHLIQSRRTMSF
jgi:hypothetical protein